MSPRRPSLLRGPLRLLAAGILLTLVALTFGAGTLLVAGLGLVVLAIALPAWLVVMALSLRVERTLDRDRVEEGEPVRALITMDRRTPFVLRVRLRDPLHAREPELPALRQRRLQVSVQASFPRRGRVHLDPTQVILSDPLSVSRVARTARGGGDELLVLPAILPVSWSGPRPSGRERAHLERGDGEPLAALEVDGLRPYRPGTSASRIHWPSLARGAGLMERRLRADGDELPLVALDTGGPGEAQDLDAAVRAAASLAVDLARHGGCRLLIGAAGRPLTLRRDLAGWPQAHAALALLEGASGAPLGRLPLAAGALLVLVCAYWPPRVPSASSTTILVVPEHAAPQGMRTRMHVAGCVGVDVQGRGALAA